MAIIIPTTWSSTAAYSVGDRVEYNGVGYEAEVDILADDDGSPAPVANDDWLVFAVFRIVDYYSLQEAIAQTINTDDQRILDSIPLFIQRAERKFGKLLRSPAQKINRVFTLDGDSKFPIPDDLLAVTHMRLNQDKSGYDIRSRGSISFQRADRTTYENLRQFYNNGNRISAYDDPGLYPKFYSDATYFYLAPDYDSGTEIQLEYYQSVGELGSIGELVNDDYEFINAEGQTLAEWIAADPENNNADNFVVATIPIVSNLWSATQPHLFKAGALVEAFNQLRDYESLQVWQAAYSELLASAEIEFRKYDTSGSQDLEQYYAY